MEGSHYRFGKGEVMKDAELKITLIADSGYVSAEKHRISVDQWSRISAIIHETEADDDVLYSSTTDQNGNQLNVFLSPEIAAVCWQDTDEADFATGLEIIEKGK